VLILCIEGYADPADYTDQYTAYTFRLGGAKKAIGFLRDHGVSDLVLLGSIKRPTWRDLRPDTLAIRILGSAALSGGDDALLRRVVEYLERNEGLTVWPVSAVLENITVLPGLLGSTPIPDDAKEDIARGVSVLRAMGPLDIGQSVVSQNSIILGVEAAEGTDALIARCGDFMRPGCGAVLVKLAKSVQIDKADLPTIGPQTVRGVSEAGFSGIAIEAGRTLVVDQEETIRIADELGIFVFAVDDIDA